MRPKTFPSKRRWVVRGTTPVPGGISHGPTASMSSAVVVGSGPNGLAAVARVHRLGEPVRELVKHQETHCPSGRLVVSENATGAAIEPAYDPAIVLLEDPQKECSGPIAVRGGIRLTSSQCTAYETRNRMTLCRCGKSANKPFCDGTHADVAFEDGLS